MKVWSDSLYIEAGATDRGLEGQLGILRGGSDGSSAVDPACPGWNDND
jgi:hypothetical protein